MFKVVSLFLMGLALLAPQPVMAGQRHVAPSAVVSVLRNGGNYVSYNGNQCLKWESGGKALAAVEPGVGHYPAQYALGGGVNGTLAMDGSINECVAFCRMCTNAPGSSGWRQGPPAIFPTGIRNQITQGTVLANFSSSTTYQGHCVVFAGWTTNGDMSAWQQNVKTRAITWVTIPATGRGGYNDAKAYYVVETS